MSRSRLIVPSALALALVALLAATRPALLTDLDRTAADAFARQTTPPSASPRVAIVVVDEASLAEFGQWPWPRDIVARLVTSLRDAGAAVIAFDILFPEPDRLGTPSASGGAPTSTDQVLVDAIRSAPVVAGFALSFDRRPAGAHTPTCVLHPIEPIQRQTGDTEPTAHLFTGTSAVCNVEALGRAASATGTINASADSDSVLRRIPLLTRLDGLVHPSLSLAAVQLAEHPSLLLETAADDTLRLRLDAREVALDRSGNLLMRLRGPSRTYPHLSAADVMAGRTPPGALDGRVVFVGATALGVHDVVATAIDPRFPGVELHATAADTLLGGAASRRPLFADALESGLALAASVLAVLFVGSFGSVKGGLTVAASGGASWFAARALYQATGVVVSPVGTLAGLAIGSVVSGAYQIAAERRRAEHEHLRRQQAQRLIVQTLTSLTETRDVATGRHARRTQEYVRLLASTLAKNPRYAAELTPERIDLIATLAPLHDIGKVGISDAVLNKPGHLTDDEFAEMRTHAELGHESLLKAEHLAGVHDNEVLNVAKEIVYTHHERWDGSGYPRGLCGTAIPLPGRLVAVVDVYDALVEKRAYKDAMSHGRALEIISAGRGTHFDPDVVDAFVLIQGQLEHAEHAADLLTPAGRA